MKTKSIRMEVLTAYADCHEVKVKGERNLSYLASRAVGGKEFVTLMNEALPGGYNDFDLDAAERVVNAFGEDAKYTIAREGSVCVYVKPKKVLDSIREGIQLGRLADEFSYQGDGVFRLWWD